MLLPIILIDRKTTFCSMTGFVVGAINVRPFVLNVQLFTKYGQQVRFLSNLCFLQKTLLVDWFVDLYLIWFLFPIPIRHGEL